MEKAVLKGPINHFQWFPSWQRLMAGGGMLLVALGLLATHVFAKLSTSAVRHNLAIAICILLSGYVISRVCRIRVASGIAITVAILLARFLGISAMAAAGLTLGASIVIGEKIRGQVRPLDSVTSAMCGLGLLTGITGWLLPFHVHFFLIYLIPLTVVCVFGRHRIFRALRRGRILWSAGVSAAPKHAALALLIIASASTALMLPVLQFDDVAFHMLLPTQLLSLGRYKMDVASQAWALAPWASDIFQAYIAILCGKLVTGAGAGSWFLMTLAGLWQLGRVMGLRAGIRWLSLAIYASTPLVACLNASMQADGAIGAATVALVVIAAKALRFRNCSAILPFTIVSGLLVSLKTTQALLVVPFAVMLLVLYKPRRFIWQGVRALPLTALVCGSSYFYAWYITGNPIFPLFNAVFKSPFGPATNFDDLRWHQGLHWDSLWQVTFHTDKFVEAYPGAFGFSLLALSGCVLASFLMPRLRWLSLPLLACMTSIFFGIQYARYVIPTVAPVLLIALVAWQEIGFQKFGELILAALVSLNVSFAPTSNWIFSDSIPWHNLSAINHPPDEARDLIYRATVPEMLVQRYLTARYHNDYFVYLADNQRPYEGIFQGNAVTNSSYDPTFLEAATHADADPSGLTWISLFSRAGVDHVLLYNDASVALKNALDRMHGVEEYHVGQARLWRLCINECNATEFQLLSARDIGKTLRSF